MFGGLGDLPRYCYAAQYHQREHIVDQLTTVRTSTFLSTV